MAINRRDFLQGAALMIGGTPLLARGGGVAGGVVAGGGDYYPPALTGMRGSHAGSFEVAHALAWQGRRWQRPDAVQDADYDLIVVGAGISGLAAAHFYRSRVGADARILILDNHDDFGGHARRNEFSVSGRGLIGYGGSQTLESPGRYSIAARGLLRELGVDTERFRVYYDQQFDSRYGLGNGVLFPSGQRGGLYPAVLGWGVNVPGDEAAALIDRYPLGESARRSLRALYVEPLRFSESVQAMLRSARSTPCEVFLQAAFGFEEEGLAFLRDISRPLWGCGLDGLSVQETVFEYTLGARLAEAAYEVVASIGDPIHGRDEDEPYICHFPDGNASIARLLVRALVPGFLSGHTMEDVVTARADYHQLDQSAHRVRIRLNSTAVDVRNAEGGVEVTYVRGNSASRDDPAQGSAAGGGSVERVRAAHCVLACYNRMIPHLASEIADEQRAALLYPEKVPFALVNVAVRNWRSLADSRISGFYAPGGFLTYGGLDFPVSMGGYAFPMKPEDPAVLQFWHAPAEGPVGANPKAGFRAGRRKLYETSFEEMERAILAQLDTAWGPHGLDVEAHLAAITINRWPHGYAYEYMDLWDDARWGRGAGPHILGRQQIGNIAIANSDSEQYAYVNGAIDAAYRSVRELTT